MAFAVYGKVLEEDECVVVLVVCADHELGKKALLALDELGVVVDALVPVPVPVPVATELEEELGVQSYKTME